MAVANSEPHPLTGHNWNCAWATIHIGSRGTSILSRVRMWQLGSPALAGELRSGLAPAPRCSSWHFRQGRECLGCSRSCCRRFHRAGRSCRCARSPRYGAVAGEDTMWRLVLSQTFFLDVGLEGVGIGLVEALPVPRTDAPILGRDAMKRLAVLWDGPAQSMRVWVRPGPGKEQVGERGGDAIQGFVEQGSGCQLPPALFHL
jgi:hypothetical protein